MAEEGVDAVTMVLDEDDFAEVRGLAAVLGAPDG